MRDRSARPLRPLVALGLIACLAACAGSNPASTAAASPAATRPATAGSATTSPAAPGPVASGTAGTSQAPSSRYPAAPTGVSGPAVPGSSSGSCSLLSAAQVRSLLKTDDVHTRGNENLNSIDYDCLWLGPETQTISVSWIPNDDPLPAGGYAADPIAPGAMRAQSPCGCYLWAPAAHGTSVAVMISAEPGREHAMTDQALTWALAAAAKS